MFCLAKFCQCCSAYLFLRHLTDIFELPFKFFCFFLTKKTASFLPFSLKLLETDHVILHDNISFHSSGAGKKRGKEPFWNTWSNLNNIIIFLTKKRKKHYSNILIVFSAGRRMHSFSITNMTMPPSFNVCASTAELKSQKNRLKSMLHFS